MLIPDLSTVLCVKKISLYIIVRRRRRMIAKQSLVKAGIYLTLIWN